MNRLLLGALLAMAAACGDAGSTFGDLSGRSSIPSGEPDDEGAPPSSSPATPGETSTLSSSGLDAGGEIEAGSSPTPAGDGGSDAAPPPPPPNDAFVGAAAFVAQTGPSTIKGAHGGNGNPAKLACLTAGCHAVGGNGPTFFAGGSVFKDVAGTQPAAQIEVRIKDGAGNAVLAHTDANGNFFVRAGAAVTLPAMTAARDATTKRAMVSMIASGDCNSSSCHGGAATGVIHVP